METNKLLEDNKLIAEFIGMSYDYHGQPNKYWEIYDDCDIVSSKVYPQDKDLKFHISWDWLIPALNKIYSSDDYIKYKDALGQFNKGIEVNTKYISVTWQQVVTFIKWYNEQINEPNKKS